MGEYINKIWDAHVGYQRILLRIMYYPFLLLIAVGVVAGLIQGQYLAAAFFIFVGVMLSIFRSAISRK